MLLPQLLRCRRPSLHQFLHNLDRLKVDTAPVKVLVVVVASVDAVDVVDVVDAGDEADAGDGVDGNCLYIFTYTYMGKCINL